MMHYTVNHTMHSLHTVKPGSSLDHRLAGNSVKMIVVAGNKHSVFTTPIAARNFQALLMLDGSK